MTMRLTSYERHMLAKLVRCGVDINVVIKIFKVSKPTIYFWGNQNPHSNFSDLPRNHCGKISVEVEITILYLRNTFHWGTARIQQGLICLPDFMRKEMEICVQNFRLSRTSINEVLKKHKLNGYRRKSKAWKFFRAKHKNELWQLDIKGYFKVDCRKYWIVVCIDDFSRYILLLKLFDHCPKLEEIEQSLLPLVEEHHPEKILTDNHPFDKSWEKWCNMNCIEALFAHPYYPQDKGKVERTIRNLVEEFISLLSSFPKWLRGKLEEWRIWYNNKRFHRGIKSFPAMLFC